MHQHMRHVHAYAQDGDEACTGGYGSWSKLPDMDAPRMGHAAVLWNSKIVIIGRPSPLLYVIRQTDCRVTIHKL
jgi:hypothetical protein